MRSHRSSSLGKGRSARAIGFAFAALAALAVTVGGTGRAWGAPPTPSGSHPRLFMDANTLAAYTANAAKSSTAAAGLVAACQTTLDHPSYYTSRGGSDADTWPGAAMSCAFAYVVTQKATFLTQAIKYWNAALDDDQALGDGLGCVATADTNWQSWTGSTPPPPVILTITHDTGYPMRFYGPDMALTYDWLWNAPGVDEALRSHTRMCLSNWVDYYTKSGYHNTEPGSNYNAGYVVAKALTAVAMGGENGATSDRIWTETVDDVFGQLLVGQGLAGDMTGIGTPAGVMVGGDWDEGWQYGPLSVAEYAAAARAVEENGAPLPDMDSWINALIVRHIHATVPQLGGEYVGGDMDSSSIYAGPSSNEFDAVLLGPSSDQAAAWALFMKQAEKATQGSVFFWNALAETRAVTPQDYRTQTPAPPLWYLARGTRNMYMRSAWSPDAFWATFASGPHLNADHQHFNASSFVFSRGGDHLVVDASNYGENGSLETNAVTADSSVVTGSYAPSQTPWSKADLPWARGTDGGVYAARGDFAHAFDFTSTASDIHYAHREFVMLPEGEIVTIDRAHTSAASRSMYIAFHTNTAGTLKLDASTATATGTVGGSQLVIHTVAVSGGTPAIVKPEVGGCTATCSYPCGVCDAARFAIDEYQLKVPGAWAVATHVLDGLASGEAPAEVGSLNDDNFDPAPKQNAGVIGAAVYRAQKQSYVVASSAQDGASSATMTYGVPGGSPARHIVFDAPEDGSGSSLVTASAGSGRCVVSITAGAGFAGHPLMFQVGAASDGCIVTEDTNVASSTPPPGGGVVSRPGSGSGNAGGGSSGSSGGGSGGSGEKNGAVSGACGCTVDNASPLAATTLSALLALVGAIALAVRRRR